MTVTCRRFCHPPGDRFQGRKAQRHDPSPENEEYGMRNQKQSMGSPLTFWCMFAVAFAIITGLIFSMLMSFYLAAGI